MSQNTGDHSSFFLEEKIVSGGDNRTRLTNSSRGSEEAVRLIDKKLFIRQPEISGDSLGLFRE